MSQRTNHTLNFRQSSDIIDLNCLYVELTRKGTNISKFNSYFDHKNGKGTNCSVLKISKYAKIEIIPA